MIPSVFSYGIDNAEDIIDYVNNVKSFDKRRIFRLQIIVFKWGL